MGIHKIKDLAEKLDEIKKQELNVGCTIIEDITYVLTTEAVITLETEDQLTIHKDESYSSKLEQCKAFSSEDTTESDLDNDFNLTTHNDEPYSSKLDCCKAFSSDDMLI